MEHVGELPRGLGGVALDGVRERVHAGGGGEARGHAGHHVRVDDGDLGRVIGVDAHELADLLRVSDHVVDGDLGRGAGGGGHGDGEDGVLLGVGHALERAHVGELRVLDDDADGLGGVHRGAAADGDDRVGLGVLEGLDAVGHVLDGGVGLDLGVEAPVDPGLGEQVGDLGGDAELHEVGVGGHEDLLEAATLKLAGNLLDGARAMVGDGVEYDAVDCHVPLLLMGTRTAATIARTHACSRAAGPSRDPALPGGFAPFGRFRMGPTLCAGSVACRHASAPPGPLPGGSKR